MATIRHPIVYLGLTAEGRPPREATVNKQIVCGWQRAVFLAIAAIGCEAGAQRAPDASVDTAGGGAVSPDPGGGTVPSSDLAREVSAGSDPGGGADGDPGAGDEGGLPDVSIVDPCDGMECPTDDDPCTQEGCDPVFGCLPPLPDGTACGTVDACRSEGVCFGGVCVQAVLSCDDGDECTLDTCDPVEGCVSVFGQFLDVVVPANPARVPPIDLELDGDGDLVINHGESGIEFFDPSGRGYFAQRNGTDEFRRSLPAGGSELYVDLTGYTHGFYPAEHLYWGAVHIRGMDWRGDNLYVAIPSGHLIDAILVYVPIGRILRLRVGDELPFDAWASVEGARSIAFQPGGAYLVAVGDAQTVALHVDPSEEEGDLVVIDADGNKVFRHTDLGPAAPLFPRFGDIEFGPDGHLYASDKRHDAVSRYHLDEAGALLWLGYVIPPGHGGLFYPTGLAFDDDGTLYVANGDGAVLRFAGATLTCDDGDACTAFDCCTLQGCEGVPVEGAGDCPDDGNPCTREVCAEGAGCVSLEAVHCMSDGDPCNREACDAATGECGSTPVANGERCDDGNPCTREDVCLAGTCGGLVLACSDDGDPCTVDACSPLTGACHTPRPSGAPCDDGDPCTEGDACDANGGCVGSPKACIPDDNPCAEAVCDNRTGACRPSPLPDRRPCDDGDPCTDPDRCVAGTCRGEPIDCPSSGDCLQSSCGPDGCVETASPDWTRCRDEGCAHDGQCWRGVCLDEVGPPQETCLVWGALQSGAFAPDGSRLSDGEQAAPLKDITARIEGTLRVRIAQPDDLAAGAFAGVAGREGTGLRLEGSASGEVVVDVLPPSTTLLSGETFCPVGFGVQLSWSATAGAYDGHLSADQPLIAEAIDARGDVLQGPDGVAVQARFSGLPTNPPPDDVHGFFPPTLRWMHAQDVCSHVAALRLRVPPATGPGALSLPIRSIIFLY